ncbi:MAG TPA: HD domain-containing phosphohydrolase [Clostridia bacterium]|nr:HD domain-containing phosphohydrolase [Clostridia bacterium]
MSPSVYYAADIKTLLKKLSTDQIDHMTSVGVYAGIMAQKMNDCRIYPRCFNQRQIEQISEAAFYHDIGKAWLPQEIVSKCGDLTTKELLAVRQHTLLALRQFDYINSHVISGVPRCLIPLSCDAAVYHHEHWDGGGYPFGLSGNNIPLIARIVAICDCYDKETAQKENGHRIACHSIAQGAGTQFDPALTRVFVGHNRDFAAALCSYRNSDWF